jgi:2-polyprenyl-6-methoxyphenol hydroxylase-like FAD-dependent oxidoreductase
MGKNYQLAIIGSGSGGRAASLLAARNGLRTALIERDKIGGTSFHSGCNAVLALQASAREFRDRWRSGRFGNRVERCRETLRDWMRTQSNVSSRLVDHFAHSIGAIRHRSLSRIWSLPRRTDNSNCRSERYDQDDRRRQYDCGDRFASKVRKQLGAEIGEQRSIAVRCAGFHSPLRRRFAHPPPGTEAGPALV